MIQEKYFYTISPDINGIKKKKILWLRVLLVCSQEEKTNF